MNINWYLKIFVYLKKNNLSDLHTKSSMAITPVPLIKLCNLFLNYRMSTAVQHR